MFKINIWRCYVYDIVCFFSTNTIQKYLKTDNLSEAMNLYGQLMMTPHKIFEHLKINDPRICYANDIIC